MPNYGSPRENLPEAVAVGGPVAQLIPTGTVVHAVVRVPPYTMQTPIVAVGAVWGPTCQRCGQQFIRDPNKTQDDKDYYHCERCCTPTTRNCVVS